MTIGFLATVAAITILADGISPDGAHTSTLPRNPDGSILEVGDPLLAFNTCSNSPVNFDNPQDLDRSLQRAGWEIVLGGLPTMGKGIIKNAPKLLKTLSDDVVKRFVYDGDHIALTFDGLGNQTERFLHSTQID